MMGDSTGLTMSFSYALAVVVAVVIGASICLKQEIPATLGTLGFILAFAKIG
jgi:hypothetical protein